jgi:hypothetical protein
MAISQAVNAITGTPPNRNDPAHFDERADAFVSQLPVFQSQLAAWSTQANTTQVEVNATQKAAEANRDSALLYRNQTLDYRNQVVGNYNNAFIAADRAEAALVATVQKVDELNAVDVAALISDLEDADLGVSIL